MESTICALALTVVAGALTPVSSVRMFEPLGDSDHVPSFNSALDWKWQEYISTHKKTYMNDAERNTRRQIWEENLSKIYTHNQEMALGHHSYTMGVNQFTDMTTHEFAASYLSGIQLSPTLPITFIDNSFGNDSSVNLPDEIDWQCKGYVTPVKNQGDCRSCWAFSATGAIEGQHAKLTKKLVSLSEQNLIDCSSKYGNSGCQGGYVDKAFTYLIDDNKGIQTYEYYSYSGKNGPCGQTNDCIGANVTSYEQAAGGDMSLQKVVAEVGPVSVYIKTTDHFLKYKLGIFSDNSCNTAKHIIDHAVLVVGYTRDYWIVKNR